MAGKAISSENMTKLQTIHDNSSDMGASCSPFMGMGGLYESEKEGARVFEAALPHTDSHDSLRGHLSTALHDAYGLDSSAWDQPSPSVYDVFPGHVVYRHEGVMRKRPYTVKQGKAGHDPVIKLGDSKQVHVAYMDTQEAMKESVVLERNIPDAERKGAADEDFAGKGRSFPILATEDVSAALHSIGRAGYGNHNSATLKKNILAIAKRKGFAAPKESVIITDEEGVIQVQEGVHILEVRVKEGGVLPKPIPVKIIAPGWGSSAYYSKEMLQQSGPAVFTKGTHMMWNHATDSQEAERPEGDLNNLAAVLTKDAYYDEKGPKGPGLYSEAKVFSDFATQVAEKGPHIGISINAGIKCHEGEAEGKSGRIADKFVRAFSTDFVTKPGAGGAPVVPVLESARGDAPQKGENSMEVKEAEALQATNATLVTENAGLKSRIEKIEAEQNTRLAVATVGAVLKEAGIKYSEKLLTLVCGTPKMKEGEVDAEWVKSIIANFTEGEPSGKVTDMGDGSKDQPATEAAAISKSLEASLLALGTPKDGIKVAMEGRA